MFLLQSWFVIFVSGFSPTNVVSRSKELQWKEGRLSDLKEILKSSFLNKPEIGLYLIKAT
jgi:hypothetical protein